MGRGRGSGPGRSGASSLVPAREGLGLAHNVAVGRDSFIVAFSELRAGAERRVVRTGRLASALVADVDSRVPAGTEAVAEVVVAAFDGGVSVSGTVTAAWEGECRRCLAHLEGPLVAPVKEIFRRGGGPDEGTYPMAEDQLNLREMVLDSLFAALPVLPLCQEGCLGLCPTCGADRNVSSCGCRQDEVDPRWSALEVLREGERRA